MPNFEIRNISKPIPPFTLPSIHFTSAAIYGLVEVEGLMGSFLCARYCAEL